MPAGQHVVVIVTAVQSLLLAVEVLLVARLLLAVLHVEAHGQDGYHRPRVTGLRGDHADPDREVLPVLLLDLARVKLAAPRGEANFGAEDLPEVLDLFDRDARRDFLFELGYEPSRLLLALAGPDEGGRAGNR